MIPNPLTEIHAIICSINDLISITGFVKYIMVIMVGGHYAAEQRYSSTTFCASALRQSLLVENKLM